MTLSWALLKLNVLRSHLRKKKILQTAILELRIQKKRFQKRFWNQGHEKIATDISAVSILLTTFGYKYAVSCLFFLNYGVEV